MKKTQASLVLFDPADDLAGEGDVLHCRVHTCLQAGIAQQAGSVPPEFPAGLSNSSSKEDEERFQNRLREWCLIEVVCGVDEAGRGPLAGPVFAAAVILDPAKLIVGLRDSKKLTAARRDTLAIQIKSDALAWSIAQCSEAEIDTLNILQASMLAMRRAIEGLHIQPTLALIDGNRCPVIGVRAQAIIQGDDKVPAISAASILAKTARDAALVLLHQQYPDYAFDQHKGYPTALHLERLRAHGVSPVHRKSYAPVRALLDLE